MDNDLTANTYGTMERDQNGEVAALIKVVTKAQGFLFDGGMTGIVRVKQDVGEVWVYVPHGIKRITIKHPDLGVLRDYYFPLPIEKAKTYEMKLSTGKVETIVTHSVNKQFVSFQVSPANAIVELNDEMLEVDVDGHAEKVVSYGKYTYRVSSPDYHTQAGTLNVTADNKVVVKVNLKPNFGWLQLDAKEEFHGAYAYVDNERMGQLPLITKGLKSGKHHLKVVKPLYKTYEQDISISDNDTLALQVKLDANFARVQLHAPDSDCEIFIDGKAVSQGSWSGGLEVGEYLVEVRKASHRSAQEVVTILNHEDRSVQLPKPTPITTFVAISSSPSEAKVFIDGKEMGETPLMLSEVLIGEREIKFVKEGRL
ncbi:MAG: PEGA domain-containing protein, partial [Bacteroidales bacterium]|nr:PEGA domain-containing protein [Bacteroidales bacterium]